MEETDRPQVAVEHRARVAAAVGIAAAVVTVAWFSRALQTSSPLDWAVCVVVTAIGVLQLLVIRDSRAPLLLADEQGVRVRHGETWSGLRWQDIDHIEVRHPRRGLLGWLRDGKVVLHPVVAELPEELPTESLDLPAPESYVVPLSVTTRVTSVGLSGELSADLDELAEGRAPVMVLTRVVPAAPAAEEKAEPEDAAGAASEQGEDDTEDETEEAAEEETGEAAEPELPEQFDPVEPGRAPRPAARAEVTRETVRVQPTAPAVPAQKSTAEPVVVAAIEESVIEASPPARLTQVPREDPVIGPLVLAARTRARLSIDELSERTRIRPHVLESIEVDDFVPCGGDFYARGHLRTLARIFGLDAQQLLDLYDELYASAEIEARQVFEAELATGIGGGLRTTATGPRWTLLAASVLALALVWGAARIFSDTPQELVSPAPEVVDTAGLASGAEQAEEPRSTLAPLLVAAKGGDPQVVVRDRDGRILWAGKLGDGKEQQVIGLAPFEVTASNGGAVKVTFLGKPRGTVGDTAEAGSKQYG
ncbi:MAG TPA: helix-turn-helix domain-containing protein [Marmoricola sp.]|nr:helix-turn-helix domain-containing protein [Marmoricola sp.]